MTTGDARPRPRRRLPLRGLLATACLAFIALGSWQVERRAWKLDLIHRVEARIHAAPVDPPGPAAWPGLRLADDEYRHVRVSGVFDPSAATRVQAVTELGPGHWLMAPMRRSDDGSTVLVNRGFVGSAGAGAGAGAAGAVAAEPVAGAAVPVPVVAPAPAATVTVTGLLRLSEPGGGFLRRNDPATGRWYSRDVAAIAAARQLTGPVAPYFIDAEAEAEAASASASARPVEPVAGLTVVSFRNNHLVYALTWYGLAALSVVGLWQVRRAGDG